MADRRGHPLTVAAMPALQHSFKTLKREWRSGELRLIAAALVVAVAAVTAVTLFTDRVRQAMVLRANTLLAADLALDSSFPIAEPYLDEAPRLGLETAQTLSFHGMLVVGERMQLVEVKAVEGDYPLRGRLAVGRDPFAAPVPTDAVPEPGIAWADAQLAQVLKLAPGQGITVGDAKLAVGPVLLYEPDRGGESFHIAPRLLMNGADVPATGLIAPGSRVSYRLLVAGEPNAIADYRSFVEARANEAVELVSVRDARPALAKGRGPLGRGEVVWVRPGRCPGGYAGRRGPQFLARTRSTGSRSNGLDRQGGRAWERRPLARSSTSYSDRRSLRANVSASRVSRLTLRGVRD